MWSLVSFLHIPPQPHIWLTDKFITIHQKEYLSILESGKMLFPNFGSGGIGNPSEKFWSF